MAPDRALTLLADDGFRSVPVKVRKLAGNMAAGLHSGISIGKVMEKSGAFPAELCLFMQQHYAGSITVEALEAFQEYYDSSRADAAALWKSFVYPLIIVLPMPFIILNIVYFIQPQFEAIFASLMPHVDLTISQLILKFVSGFVTGFLEFFSSCLDSFWELSGLADAWFAEPLTILLNGFFSLFILLAELIFFFIALLPFLSLMPDPPRFLIRINHYMSFLFPVFKNTRALRKAVLFARLAEALRHKGGPVQELNDFLRRELSRKEMFTSGILHLRWQSALAADDFVVHFAEFRTVCREKIANSVAVFHSISEPLSVVTVSLVTVCLVMSVFDYVNMMLQFCLSF
jgi:type II secretory pathway component PulF